VNVIFQLIDIFLLDRKNGSSIGLSAKIKQSPQQQQIQGTIFISSIKMNTTTQGKVNHITGAITSGPNSAGMPVISAFDSHPDIQQAVKNENSNPSATSQ
jgi:hypothetical protein